ncbi:MAG: PDZ domain-containing protein [Saprospiraceae bacterium]
MKKINILLPMMALLFSCWSNPTFAQDTKKESQIIIIKKSIDENGVEVIEKTIKSGDDANAFILENGDGENISIDVEANDGEEHQITIITNGAEGEKTFTWNESNMEELEEQMEELEEHMEEVERIIVMKEEDFMKGNHSFNSCNNKKPFLGIVMQESVTNENGNERVEGISDEGVFIQRVVEGSAAEAAGLQKGDVLTAIDGQPTPRVAKASELIKAKKVGDAISVSYIRDGNAKTTTATLKSRAESNDFGNIGRQIERSFESFDFDFDFDFDHSYDYDRKVDPCKVFIGVYTGTGSDARGLRVSGVIEETPAFDAGLLKGDRITALDGVNINSHSTLLKERNKHNPGDVFTISYLRDGQSYTVDAQFKECEKEETEKEIEKEEELEERTDDRSMNMLDLNLKAFPNPTNAFVNVRFAGDRVPTTVTLTDIKGQEIYREVMNNFDGLYNEKISLKQAATGPVIVTVQQGNKVRSEKVLYTPDRA